MAATNEMQSKEISLQYREKRMEQERNLLNSQIAGLAEEVNRLTNELQTVRLNYTSRTVTLESQVAEKSEELNGCNITIAQLNELKNDLNAKAVSLCQKLLEQRETENEIVDNFKMELEAKQKLADLYENMYDDSEAKTIELTEGILELQKLLNEATEKYGDLETKCKQLEADHEEEVEKLNEKISKLNSELQNTNDLLKFAHSQNLDSALNELAPSAAAASKLIKSGMSLTQVYSQLVKLSEELEKEKEESRKLNITLNTIVQELEEKAPVLQKQKAEYEEALENASALRRQLESVVNECNRLQDVFSEATKVSNNYNRENTRIKSEMADLRRQVCFLLKEKEESRGGQLANGDHDPSLESPNNSGITSSRIISKTLVTFSDIQELQSNNQKLLRLVRELTDKNEELEKRKEEFESGEMEKKVENLSSRVIELTEAQDRHTKMVNGLIRQRDMYKNLNHDLMNNKGKKVSETSVLEEQSEANRSAMDTSGSEEKNSSKSLNVSLSENKLKETEKQLELLREYKVYKEERQSTEKVLLEQIDNMRKEMSKLTSLNSKCSATAEYNNERIRILETNINTYKKQISSLEDKNKAYNETIAKHEVTLQHLRNETLNAQRKLASAEVSLESAKMENKLMKDAESRWQAEREVLQRERHGQALLLKNLESIKASIERSETERRLKVETRLDETMTECSALRRRLQEEQDRFRELSSHLERQTETAKERMREEKDAADSLRVEVEALRKDLVEKTATNDELNSKLKIALMPNTCDGTFDSIKKVKDLERQLSDRKNEIDSLQIKLQTVQEHVKQYSNISECAEKELKSLSEEFNATKNDMSTKLAESNTLVEQLKERCSELEAELSVQNNGQPTSVDLKGQLAVVFEDLKKAHQTIEEMQTELDKARSEMSKLANNLQVAEDKYAHEMMLHSADIQQLTCVKQELMKLQNDISEVTSMKMQLSDQIQANKKSWEEREKMFIAEKTEISGRLEDLLEQNAALHDQIQTLGTQLSLAYASKNTDGSMNDSVNESINLSIGEDDKRSSEQLFQIIKFLRKEKDIAIAKFDILQAECSRLKSQLEIVEKKLDEAKIALAEEREKTEVNAVTIVKHSDVLRKVETLNALTDSNRILREERDSLLIRVDELDIGVKSIEDKLTPLQEKIIELTAKNDTLQSENTSLKAETARRRTSVNALVERANKTSPEDWKRLQNERETLAKMLKTEKETVKKLQDEIQVLRNEKTKVDNEHANLLAKFQTVIEENRQKSEELITLQKDLSRLSEELNKTKEELSSVNSEKEKLSEELASKGAKLADIVNKELQIRKIDRIYKQQYEDLTKQTEEKKTIDSEQALLNTEASERLKQVEEKVIEIESQLATEKEENEKLKTELDTIRTTSGDKEEKYKQLLKTANSRIVELTETKNNVSMELNEVKSKMEAFEQSTKDEQEERLLLIKSQYEGRLSRLEKEKVEAQIEKTREVEALIQKVTLLQRQLANQQSSSKQQPNIEKPTGDPPTANIKQKKIKRRKKEKAGVSSQAACRRSSELPLASIRPMAQVGPTPPQHEHTEYMPASLSRPHHRPIATSPPESTQKRIVRAPSCSLCGPPEAEAGVTIRASSTRNAASSNSVAPIHSQSTQQVVALVMPRVEQAVPSGNTVLESASQSNSGVSTTGPGVSTSEPAAPAPDARAPKRARPASQTPTSKRTRTQGFERSEYQVPTSSRCDQDDENDIVVDSEEDDENRCSGTAYQEGEGYPEEEEDLEEEQEMDDEDDTPHQQEDAQPTPLQPEPSAPAEGVMGVSGGEEGDDGIVSSTPTLCVPRRNVGVVAGSSAGSAAPARFTFADTAPHPDTPRSHPDTPLHAPRAHLDTLPNLAPALPHDPAQASSAATEDADVSSQGSPTHHEGEGYPEEEEDLEEEQEMDDEDDTPHQQEDAQPTPLQPEPSAPAEGVMGVSGGEEGDDGIVSSTPTLCVPRRNVGVVAGSSAGSAAPARFTFADTTPHPDTPRSHPDTPLHAPRAHLDTLPNLAPALPHDPAQASSAATEDADVSSQGSPTHHEGEGYPEEEEDLEEEQEMDDEDDTPHQQEDAQPTPLQPEPSAPAEGVMGVSGGEEGDDGIVSSTPTLCVPRRNVGVVAGSSAGSAAPARFTFADTTPHPDTPRSHPDTPLHAPRAHLDTLPNLAPALPHDPAQASSAATEDADVSSQGSPTHHEGEGYPEEEEDLEEEQEMDDEDDTPHQQEDAQPTPLQPEPSAPAEGVMGVSGGEEGDDGIVSSTPTLCVPRRNVGVVAGSSAGSAAPARFTFADTTPHPDTSRSHPDTPLHAPRAHLDTLPNLAPALPHDPAQASSAATEDADVSSQGSPTHHDEEREAEASSAEKRRRTRQQQRRFPAHWSPSGGLQNANTLRRIKRSGYSSTLKRRTSAGTLIIEYEAPRLKKATLSSDEKITSVNDSRSKEASHKNDVTKPVLPYQESDDWD